jgi:hypothetical protein
MNREQFIYSLNEGKKFSEYKAVTCSESLIFLQGPGVVPSILIHWGPQKGYNVPKFQVQISLYEAKLMVALKWVFLPPPPPKFPYYSISSQCAFYKG